LFFFPGNWIEMSEPYQKLIKALERRILVHQDEDVLQEVIGQFVLPDKNVITYDQIMTVRCTISYSLFNSLFNFNIIKYTLD